MKTVLAVWHSSGKGKSTTLRELRSILIKNYPNHKIIFDTLQNQPKSHDIRLVIEINGLIIGIESQGDPNTGLQKRLNDLVNQYNCDIIITASRTRGDTVTAVSSLNKHDFEEIWTSTYQMSGEASQAIANKLKAKHILELLQALYASL